MEELKTLFGEGSLNYNEFEQKLSEAKDSIKLANLQGGKYVDRDSYEKLKTKEENLKTQYNELLEKTKDYDEVKANLEKANNSIVEYEKKKEIEDKMKLILKANVEEDFAEFVYNKVSSLTDDETDFQKALNDFLGEHEKFLKNTNTKGTYVNLENGSTTQKSANQIMNDFIRRKGR